jgi:hypothetical protein
MLRVMAARIRKVFQKLIGSSRILLFYSCLPDKRLVVYPNQRQVVCSPCLTDKVQNHATKIVMKNTPFCCH